MPIVVLSATPVGVKARDAGADVFLQKPQDVSSLVETINRLLEEVRKRVEMLESSEWKIRLGRDVDLSPAEPFAMLGRANAGREWLCGGIRL